MLLLLLLFLFPFSHPHSDDYSYNQFLQEKGYLAATAYVFTHNGGRFLATAILFMSPLGTKLPEAYPLLNAALLIAFVIAAALFWRVLSGKRHFILSTACFLLCYLSFLPDLHEFSYWLAGAATYLSAATLFLTLCSLHLLLLRPQYENCRILWITSALNTLLLCGCSEAGLLMVLIPQSLHLHWRRQQKLRLRNIHILSVLWLLTSIVIVLSPGSMHRHTQTPFSGQALLTLGGGLYASLYWLLQWSLPLLVAGLAYATLVAPLLTKRTQALTTYIHPKTLLAASLLFFYACQAAAVWMSGSMPEERYENLLFLAALTLTLLQVQLWVNRREKPEKPYVLKASALSLISALLLLPNNFTKAAHDLISGSAVKFHQQTLQRYQLLRNDTSDISKVPAVTAEPNLLYYPALSCDSVADQKDVPRRAMAEYFGKKWIYEYPCRPKKSESAFKTLLKQKRKDWFSDLKQ